ncbi:unnamed protein product [Callosobruchus maculatus]|uniref:Uncharacterized protein n=1 Tax=Callosobruchus maculatus TaxID=64391 RepID=A0A653CV85_CALMS|nr:unnamed protein product [Callosobruchus maculatus]VEN60563.1 unnamed protein product [Callosobruchus maculatus]
MGVLNYTVKFENKVDEDRKVMRAQDERDANLSENVEHKDLLVTANVADG